MITSLTAEVELDNGSEFEVDVEIKTHRVNWGADADGRRGIMTNFLDSVVIRNVFPTPTAEEKKAMQEKIEENWDECLESRSVRRYVCL